MADRTQINIRIDNELVEAMKARCEEEGSTQTLFIIAAIRMALGMPPSAPSVLDMTELDKLIEEKLETRLSPILERLSNLEERQQLGKSPRPLRHRRKEAV